MPKLPMVLLLHTAATGRHYDLLVLDPTLPRGGEHRLWAARVRLPSTLWAGVRRLELIPLPAHRVAYLTRQGPLGGNRGSVRRVDRGHARARRWTQRLIILDLSTRHFQGRLTLIRRGPRRWVGVVRATALANQRGRALS